MSLITIEDLKLGYNKKAVLEGLNFSIDERDFICIVGPNGAGKTTLIRGLLGIIRPMAGKIYYEEISRNTIGYMPQETAIDPNFPASVLEVVLSGTLNKNRLFYGKTAIGKALEAIDELGIMELKDKSFSELSGGQRQKVLLARAIVATEKLLILDEPSNNLDQKSKKELYRLIQKINTSKKIAVIMVTHDLDHGNLIGNKILSLREGDIFFGLTDDFIRRVHNE
ncbi:MAG: metal ABC transporter ATP-binding protein [Candidatus Saccharibacteria bacterium]|nr:metal ABC transporter ATP-binding protein [Candidatus Saccharibacteria bacterium]